MKITEMIAQLEALKEKHGDLPVLLQTDCEYQFPYNEVVSMSAILNLEVFDEADVREGEILNFIALDYM